MPGPRSVTVTAIHRPLRAAATLDLAAGPVAAVAHRIADQIVEHLDAAGRGRRAPAAGRRAARTTNSHWPPRRLCATLAMALSATSASRHAVARSDEAVGLDPRQAHQILDDAQHPPRFVANGRAELRAQLGRRGRPPRPGSRNSRGWSTAESAARGWRWRRSRRASSRPRRRRSGRSSGPAPRPRPSWRMISRHERPSSPMPVTSISPEPCGKDLLERLRVADREADVAPFDRRAPSKPIARRVGEPHDAALDDQAGSSSASIIARTLRRESSHAGVFSRLIARRPRPTKTRPPRRWTRGPPFEPKGRE